MELVNIPSLDIQLASAVIAPESPRAAVVLIHGMAEHKERYFPFMTYLAEKGFACVIPDLRGHGASVPSEADLGYFGKKGRSKVIEDVLSVVQWTRNRYPGLKLFLFGHSMGSLIVRCFAKEYDAQIDGLMVCGSPSRNGAAGIGIFLTRVIGLFKGERYRSPMLENLSTGAYEKKFKGEALTNAWLSTNKANVQAYNNDPLCGFRFTVNGYRVLLQLLRDTYAEKGWTVAAPKLPVHFICGSEDPCIGSLKKFASAVSFMRSRGYTTVTSKVYPKMRHEILNELGKEDVWRDAEQILSNWL